MTSPPWTGFGRRFHLSTLTRTSPVWTCELSRPSAERAVSCRLLQSKQPTSTTTNLPSPGRDRRHDAPSSRWVGRIPPGGVGAPSASSTAESRCCRARRRPRPRSPGQQLARHQPGFQEPGGCPTSGATTLSRRRLPESRPRALCWHTHGREALTQARSARAPPVARWLRCRLEIRYRRSNDRPAEADAEGRSELPAA